MAPIRMLVTASAIVASAITIVYIALSIVFVTQQNQSQNNVNVALACLESGSCLGGNPVFDVVYSVEPIAAPNIPTGPIVETIDLVTGSPEAGNIDFVTPIGSNLLIIADGPRINMTAAIVVNTLTVTETTQFGINTSCVRPLDASCYNISGQSCSANNALGQSCLQLNASIANVTVDGTFHCLNCANASSLNTTQNLTYTDLTLSMLYVTQSAQLHNNWTCSGPGIADNCFDLSQTTCPNGPWAASCIPSSLIWYNLDVIDTLRVNNTQCLGPPIPRSCFSNTVVTGQVNGSYATGTLVVSFRGTPINAGPPLATPSALVVQSGTWIDYPVVASVAQPNSLVARDPGANSTFNVVTATASLIKGPANGQCLGLGRPKSVFGDSLDYYILASASTASGFSYFTPINKVLRYNVATDTTTLLGTVNNTASNGFYMHPNGALYVLDAGKLCLIDTMTFSCYVVCPTVSDVFLPFGFHLSGIFYYITSASALRAFDLATCTLSTIKVVNITMTNQMLVRPCIIGDTGYWTDGTAGNRKIYSVDLRASTSTTVITRQYVYPLGQYVSATGLFPACINGTVFLGLFHVSTSSQKVTILLDSVSGNLISGVNFFFTDLGPGDIFGNGIGTNPTYYYPSFSGVSRCFVAAPQVAGSCSTGNLTLVGNDIRDVQTLYVEEIYPNTHGILTFGANVNLQSPTNALASGVIYLGPHSTWPSLSYSEGGGGGLSLSTSLEVNNIVHARSFVSTGPVSLLALAGAGTGALAIVLGSSSNCRMRISLTTGFAPAAAQPILQVNYSLIALPLVPGVVFSPANQNAWSNAKSTRAPYIDNETTASFTLYAGSAALVGCSPCIWNFQACM
jgi:hypothetical protein